MLKSIYINYLEQQESLAIRLAKCLLNYEIAMKKVSNAEVVDN